MIKLGHIVEDIKASVAKVAEQVQPSDAYGHWIGPDGTAVSVNKSHELTAIEVIHTLKRIKRITDKEYRSLNIPLNSTTEVEEFLYKRGWVRGVKDGWDYIVNGMRGQKLTLQQTRWLVNHGKTHNRIVTFCPGGENIHTSKIVIFDPESLMEVFFKSFDAHRVGKDHYVEIFKNPTTKEIQECGGFEDLGVIFLDKDAYVWDRGKALHVEVMRQLGVDYHDMLPTLINKHGNEYGVFITDAANHTKWYGEPNVELFLSNHPFFRGKIIGDISYWDEDIGGKWHEKHITEGEKHKNSRLGLCYELSGRYVSVHPDAVLVHGRLVNPFMKGHKELDHGWVEEGGEIFDPVMNKRWPKDVYENLFKAKIYKKYTFKEVIQMMDKYLHWGPWDESTTLSENRKLGKSLPQTGYKYRTVEIFRAMIGTENTLKENDYVTRSKKFAVEHADHMTAVNDESYHVMRFVVNAEHVYEAWNPGEYFYNGPSVRGAEIYNSENFI